MQQTGDEAAARDGTFMRQGLAGAIAQAQRLQVETRDPAASARAAEIEATLKRLPRLSERLMQHARAEGGRLRMDRPADLRPVLRVVSDDIARTVTPGRLVVDVPETPVLSDLAPDILAILARNLIENALRHGARGGPVEMILDPDGRLTVANDGDVIPPDRLSYLTKRFVLGNAVEGSGLGLVILTAIAQRVAAPFLFQSPGPGSDRGMAVTIQLPVSEA